MDPKEEWEKFLRGELPPGQLPISPWHNEMIRKIIQRSGAQDTYMRAEAYEAMIQRAEQSSPSEVARAKEDYEDAHLRATSSFTRAMSDKMLADCLSSNRAK
jgi:hypothetical protein